MTAESTSTKRLVPVPGQFFTDMLPNIEDLGELKVVLAVIQLSYGQGEATAWLSDILRPEMARGLISGNSPQPSPDRVRSIVARAVANGRLLRFTESGETGERNVHLLLADEHGLDIINRLRAGEAEASDEVGLENASSITFYRPNLFAFYERNLGTLTPVIAEQLREAERAYPRAWVEEAILSAVHYNKRNWRYVEAILLAWERSGGPGGGSGRHS